MLRTLRRIKAGGKGTRGVSRAVQNIGMDVALLPVVAHSPKSTTLNFAR